MSSAQQSPGEPAPHVPVWMPGQFKRRISTVHAVQLGLAEYADDPWAAWRWHGRRIPDWFGDLGAELEPTFRSEDYWYFRLTDPSGETVLIGPDDWLCRTDDGRLRARGDADFRARYLPYYSYSEAKP